MRNLPTRAALILASLLLAGLLLAGTMAAFAASTVTFVGTLEFTDPYYAVDSQVITVTNETVCTYIDGSPADPCSDMAGLTVEATVELSETVPFSATLITQLETYTGVLTEITPGDPATWKVGSLTFLVPSGVAGSFAVRDVVEVTYKNVAGDFVAVAVEGVATSEYVGKAMAIGDTSWTVNDRTFTVSGDTSIYPDPKVKDIVKVIYYGADIAVDISLYPTSEVLAKVLTVDPWTFENLDLELTFNDFYDAYANPVPFDIVKIVYYTWDGENIVSEILLYAPFKNDNARCVDWMAAEFKIPPGIEKLLPEGVNLAQVYAMFCQGFGWGEIKNAFRLSNAEHSPEALMAEKAAGKGWGVLKNEYGLKPEKVNNGKSHENEETAKVGKPDEPGKPEKNDKPENPNKPENPGNSENAKDKDNNGKANGKNK